MKILYVLVSSETDIFLEQTFLSIYSLKRKMSSSFVTLLMDAETNDSLKGIRAKILDLIEEKIVVELDKNMSNKYKSRILKTNMRNYVEGDFLYIDSDTIILDDISSIFDCEYDIAAVYEYNRSLDCLLYKNYKTTFEEAVERFGIKIDTKDELFNSGVIYVKDNVKTRDFFMKWTEKWKKGVDYGIFFDQPSLFIVNKEEKGYIAQLSGIWNSQGRYCFNYVRNSKIFHYLYDEDFDFPLLRKDSFDNLKKTGIVDEFLNNIVLDPFKFVSSRNFLITTCALDITKTRQYALLRKIYVKYNNLFTFVDKLLNLFYSFMLRIKKRRLQPPR